MPAKLECTEDDFDLYDSDVEDFLVQTLTRKKEDVKLSDEMLYFNQGED